MLIASPSAAGIGQILFRGRNGRYVTAHRFACDLTRRDPACRERTIARQSRLDREPIARGRDDSPERGKIRGMSEPAPVLLLGDPRLRVRSYEVASFGDTLFQKEVATLAASLEDFRRRHGFGRAISAPQIGIALRFIAVNLGKGTFIVANPVVTGSSDSTITMWDDCMSFPDLLVRVRRNESISLDYVDEQGKAKSWRDLDLAASELLQHEIDHLDGVLAVDRAIDRESLIMRAELERDFERYAAMVDYTISGGRR